MQGYKVRAVEIHPAFCTENQSFICKYIHLIAFQLIQLLTGHFLLFPHESDF